MSILYGICCKSSDFLYILLIVYKLFTLFLIVLFHFQESYLKSFLYLVSYVIQGVTRAIFIHVL